MSDLIEFEQPYYYSNDKILISLVIPIKHEKLKISTNCAHKTCTYINIRLKLDTKCERLNL